MTQFFISYTQTDRPWALWIRSVLEQNSYSTVVQATDFPPGTNFVLEMNKAAEAERTIAVLSPEYFASIFTQSEWAAAFRKDPTGENRVLIPVRVAQCEPPGLLGSIVYCDLVDLNQHVATARLLEAVSAETVPETEAPFPGFRARAESPMAEAESSVVTFSAKKLLGILNTTRTTFIAQTKIRDELVHKVLERLHVTEHLEYERFFQKHYTAMTEDERLLHRIIRAYTGDVLASYNRQARDLIRTQPALVEALPRLQDLQQHLDIWLAKFDGVFHATESISLVYVGVEENVPFPTGIESELERLIENP